jgi:hypothetical protein
MEWWRGESAEIENPIGEGKEGQPQGSRKSGRAMEEEKGQKRGWTRVGKTETRKDQEGEWKENQHQDPQDSCRVKK